MKNIVCGDVQALKTGTNSITPSIVMAVSVKGSNTKAAPSAEKH